MRLLLSALLSALIIVAASPALACSCMSGPDAPRAPVIVQARVVSLKAGDRQNVAVLRVLRVERGRASRQITVTTPANSAMCGVTFKPGETRRFGLERANAGYFATLCAQINLGG